MTNEEKFNELRNNWLKDYSPHIEILSQINNPDYHAIINMGWLAVPYILKELKTNPTTHWFHALNKITEQHPIQKESLGDTNKMINDWLTWAQPYRPIFPNFLEKLEEYKQAEIFWEELFIEQAVDLCQSSEWIFPWLRTTYADGKPFLDGAPIFSAYDTSNKIGIRIIQIDWDEEYCFKNSICRWRDYTGDSPALDTLVLSVCPTQENLNEIKRIIHHWMLYNQMLQE